MTQDHGSNWTPVGSTENISQTSCNLLVANLSDILSILYNFYPDCVLGAAPAAPSLFGFKSGEPPMCMCSALKRNASLMCNGRPLVYSGLS